MKNIPRKEFLNRVGLAAISAALVPARVFSGFGNDYLTEPARIGLQLYTVRNEIKDDIARSLHRVAEIGFEAVETAFWPENISVREAAKYLKNA
jgi:hypothetical protein